MFPKRNHNTKERTKAVELKITVYDDNDNVMKECTAQTVDVKFGQVAAIMESVESVEDSVQMMRMIKKAWKQLVRILSKIFPDMEDDDWNNVSLKELLPVLILILRDSFKEMMAIPKSKNE